MRKTDYLLMDSLGKECLARARLDLAALGDVDRLAASVNSCPWLNEYNCVAPNEANSHLTSIVERLCYCAGLDACERYGSILSPHPDHPDDFAKLLEEQMRREIRHTFSTPSPARAAHAFERILRGLDRNPHLPPGFGERIRAEIFSTNPDFSIAQGCPDEGSARFWLGALAASKFDSAAKAEKCVGQLTATFVHLARAGALLGDEPASAAALGRSAGEAIATLALGLEIPPNLSTIMGRWIQHDFNGGSQGPLLAVTAAIAQLDEPLLAALALHAEGAFGRVIEARRLELHAAPAAAACPPPRI